MKNTNTLIIFGHLNTDSFNGAILKFAEDKLTGKRDIYLMLFRGENTGRGIVCLQGL